MRRIILVLATRQNKNSTTPITHCLEQNLRMDPMLAACLPLPLPPAATATAPQACLCFLHFVSFLFVPSSPPPPPGPRNSGHQICARRAEMSLGNCRRQWRGYVPSFVKRNSLLGFRFVKTCKFPNQHQQHLNVPWNSQTNNYSWGQNLSHLIRGFVAFFCFWGRRSHLTSPSPIIFGTWGTTQHGSLDMDA
jgi:hypothetical protein